LSAKTQDSVAHFTICVRIVYCLADNHCFLYVPQVPRKLHGWEIALIAVGCILFLLLLLAFMWRMGWIGDRELRGKHEVKKIYEHNLFSV
jgi:hypothetical protein